MLEPDERIDGIIPVLATPFTTDLAVDEKSLRRLVQFEVGSEITALALFGLASEAFSLGEQERAEILRIVREEVGGSVAIVVGIATTGKASAIEQAKRARDGGADAVMVLPPILVAPEPAQLPDFFGGIAEASGLGVMVQDAPTVTQVAMDLSTLASVLERPDVDWVKIEAQPTALKVGRAVELLGGSAVLGGQNAQFLLEEAERGACGSMPACEFTDVLVAILRQWRKGERADAEQRFSALLPSLIYGLQPRIAWAVHKEILVRRGLIDCAAVRPPASDADRSTVAGLERTLAALRRVEPFVSER